MTRRLFAHLYDLIVLIIIVVPTFINLDSIIFNNELSNFYYILVFLIIFFLFYIFFALIPYKKEANIGQIIERLKTVATKGRLTKFRLLMKNLVSFIPYVPFIVFLTRITVKYYEIGNAYQDDGFSGVLKFINLPLLYVSLGLIVINALLNLYTSIKFSQSVSDRIFDIKITYKKHKVISINNINAPKELIQKDEKKDKN